MARILAILAVLHAVAGPVLAGEEVPGNASEEAVALRLEYGTTLALTGDLDEAEAVFSSLLAAGPSAASSWCRSAPSCGGKWRWPPPVTTATWPRRGHRAASRFDD